MKDYTLKDNIEAYRRKKYQIDALSGLFLVLGVGTSLWIVLALTEYLVNFSQVSRAIMFYGFWLIVLSMFLIRIVVPVFNWFGFGRKTDEFDAAREIGVRLSAVDDRLINALYLMRRVESDGPLAKASIDQRTVRLNAFDFSQAIDVKEGLAWLKWSLVPWFVAILISLFDGAILFQGAARIMNYNESYVPEAPFSFSILNDELAGVEGESFELLVETEGRSLPDQSFVVVGDASYRMKRTSGGSFSYVFETLREDVSFGLEGGGVVSEEWKIRVLKRPKLLNAEARAVYPAYTRMQNESFKNRNRLVVPEGTELTWQYNLVDVADLRVSKEGALLPHELNESTMRFTSDFRESRRMRIGLTGESGLVDSSFVDVVVVKDVYPQIKVDAIIDSTALVFYFNGSLEDDYGFSRLRLVVESGSEKSTYLDVPVNQSSDRQSFSLVWSADSLVDGFGASIRARFEVWDNDGVNGPKMSTSRQWEYKAPTAEEMALANEKAFDATKSTLEDERKRLEELEKRIEEGRKDLLEKKDIDWEDKQALKELLEERMEMMRNIQNRAEKQQKQLEETKKFNDYSESLMDKQQMIQEMFERLFDDEFKEKYEELNRMLDELSKEKMLEELDKAELDHEKLEKELDRTLELFKQLEFEMALEESLNRLDELVEKQEELKSKTEEKAETAEKLAEKQEQLKEDLKKFEDQIEGLEELNDALEDPNDVPSMDEDMKQAEEQMDGAKEDLQKSNNKKAGEKQQKAKESLEQMKESLGAFQDQMAMDQQTEDMENMRQLLENIMELSKRQEAVMEDLKPLKGSDPKFTEYSRKQRDIMDDTKVVEDSLLALSKRVPMIDKQVNDMITEVKFNMAKALENLSSQQPNQEQRYRAMAAERQQLAMTSLNDLALLFDSIIKSMQQQMSSSMKGAGQCQKPGDKPGSKPSAADMKKMQESLNKQLQQLKEAMEKGENPNGKKPGQSQGMGLGGESKELAQMAAQQSLIRKQLREMSESLDKSGKPGSSNDMDELAKMMEETEEDILYRKIDAETMKRQQDIMVKLLEAEKADREREMEERREAKSAANNYEVPEGIWDQFVREREKELELYQSVPPNLKPFYRNEVKRYFSIIE